MAICHPLYPVLQEREHCVKSKADFSPWTVHWLSFFVCAMGLVPASQGCGEGWRREGSGRAQSNPKGGTFVDMLWRVSPSAVSRAWMPSSLRPISALRPGLYRRHPELITPSMP